MPKPNLGTFGVFGLHQQWKSFPPTQLQQIESLGYGAIWAANSPPAELDWVDPILDVTDHIKVATGIVNIWTADAGTVADSFHRIEAAHPGRFLLGIGVGHPETQGMYKKPYDALTEYLDLLDQYGVPRAQRVVAALGPQVLKLAGRRSAGAHPYLTTPQHTAGARELLGPQAFIAPEHKVILTTDSTEARNTGRTNIEPYLGLANYVNNFKRSGFTDADVAKPGSDALIDALVAYGSTEQIVARLNQHLDAGADHVAVQVLTGADNLTPALTELAQSLDLR